MKTELVTTLKRQATKLLAELREKKEPVLITEHGRPSAYLVDVDHFEEIQKKLELFEGLARGEKAMGQQAVRMLRMVYIYSAAYKSIAALLELVTYFICGVNHSSSSSS
jgi:prevent-host-death family protein